VSERRLAAILCADVAGWSRLMGADEEGTLARLNELRAEVLDPRIAASGGRIVKTTGDGLLAEFPSAVAAVRCAVEVQQEVARRAGPIAFRIGINLGDVIHEAGDVFGDGVNIAARLEQMAEPGGLCISHAVYEQVRDKLPLDAVDLGPQQAKNIARPVWAYAVRIAADGRPAAPAAARAWRPWTLRAAALALLLAAGGGVAAVFLAELRAPAQAPAEAGPVQPETLSVAVLPLANLTGHGEDEAFVDGITEDLITDLSRISGAFVIARNTSFVYKGKAADAREVARELGVRYVLEGSVRRAGEAIRINAQLVDAETGAHVWADRFDYPRADMYRVQDEITGRVARALNMELKEAVSRRAARGRPDDLDSANLAIHGWAILFNRPQTPATNAEALPLLERAVALDPKNAEAWTGLAYVHVRAALYGWSASREEAERLALEAGERAVALDPRSADAHYVLGFAAHVTRQTERARRLFERCLELNRNYAPAYFWLGWVEIFDGRPAMAVPLVERAFRLSPRDGLAAVWRSAGAMAHLHLGNDEAAIAEAQKGIAENPEYPQNYQILAAVYALTGRVEAARETLQRGLQLRGNQRSIRQLVEAGRPTPELYAERFARYLDGLRKAGLPEG